jgi:hypothetical protein
MGIPVVAVDDVNQKISNFLNTWPELQSAVRFAPDHDAGLRWARGMAAALA